MPLLKRRQLVFGQTGILEALVHERAEALLASCAVTGMASPVGASSRMARASASRLRPLRSARAFEPLLGVVIQFADESIGPCRSPVISLSEMISLSSSPPSRPTPMPNTQPGSAYFLEERKDSARDAHALDPGRQRAGRAGAHRRAVLGPRLQHRQPDGVGDRAREAPLALHHRHDRHVDGAGADQEPARAAGQRAPRGRPDRRAASRWSASWR